MREWQRWWGAGNGSVLRIGLPCCWYSTRSVTGATPSTRSIAVGNDVLPLLEREDDSGVHYERHQSLQSQLLWLRQQLEVRPAARWYHLWYCSCYLPSPGMSHDPAAAAAPLQAAPLPEEQASSSQLLLREEVQLVSLQCELQNLKAEIEQDIAEHAAQLRALQSGCKPRAGGSESDAGDSVSSSGSSKQGADVSQVPDTGAVPDVAAAAAHTLSPATTPAPAALASNGIRVDGLAGGRSKDMEAFQLKLTPLLLGHKGQQPAAERSAAPGSPQLSGGHTTRGVDQDAVIDDWLIAADPQLAGSRAVEAAPEGDDDGLSVASALPSWRARLVPPVGPGPGSSAFSSPARSSAAFLTPRSQLGSSCAGSLTASPQPAGHLAVAVSACAELHFGRGSPCFGGLLEGASHCRHTSAGGSSVAGSECGMPASLSRVPPSADGGQGERRRPGFSARTHTGGARVRAGASSAPSSRSGSKPSTPTGHAANSAFGRSIGKGTRPVLAAQPAAALAATPEALAGASQDGGLSARRGARRQSTPGSQASSDGSKIAGAYRRYSQGGMPASGPPDLEVPGEQSYTLVCDEHESCGHQEISHACDVVCQCQR